MPWPALIGAGPANTTGYGENLGVPELSHVHDPRVIRLGAAIYAIILSILPKVADSSPFHAFSNHRRNQLHPTE